MTATQKSELLAPAGDFEKLKWACAYGADAVYFGLTFGSLRSFAGNFTEDQAIEALDYLHVRGKKGYVTLNIYPFSDEYPRLIEIAKKLDRAGADAFIVADPGLLDALALLKLNARLHVSTQANTVSSQTALLYASMGAARVNLARELSLEQIAQIQQALSDKIETEVFIHGAVCFSYSGRCAISDYLTGFGANRGECKQPCRWQYSLVEEKRPGQFMPVFEDQRGLYLFNSKELALFDYIPQLAKLGVSSFKIEGRMKSIHYLATVISLYRQIIDGHNFAESAAFEWLNRIPNRGYTTGFMKGSIDHNDYQFHRSNPSAQSLFVANVTESQNGNSALQLRNKVIAGEQLEYLTPSGTIGTVTLSSPLLTSDGQQLTDAGFSKHIILDQPLPPYTILRRLGHVDMCKD